MCICFCLWVHIIVSRWACLLYRFMTSFANHIWCLDHLDGLTHLSCISRLTKMSKMTNTFYVLLMLCGVAHRRTSLGLSVVWLSRCSVIRCTVIRCNCLEFAVAIYTWLFRRNNDRCERCLPGVVAPDSAVQWCRERKAGCTYGRGGSHAHPPRRGGGRSMS